MSYMSAINLDQQELVETVVDAIHDPEVTTDLAVNDRLNELGWISPTVAELAISLLGDLRNGDKQDQTIDRVRTLLGEESK